MNLRTIIVAFLAARSPASYAVDVIHARITRSGLLDKSPTITEVNAELQTLSAPKMGALVDVDIHPVTKDASWRATDEGVKRWTLDGRIMIGG